MLKKLSLVALIALRRVRVAQEKMVTVADFAGTWTSRS